MGRKVKDILKTKKNNSVFSVEPQSSVYSAIEQMCEKNIGGVVVVENNVLVGIFTERDYARKLILKGKSSKDTVVAEIMTKNPITVSPDTTIDDCMNVMSEKRIRHLPVTENAVLVGMISIGDVVRHIIEEQKSTIEQLEHYITGR
jgi:CBS domain-containing protein